MPAPTPDRRVTGHAVARAAGVSQATVSLVMTGKAEGRISDEQRDRVLAIARELGIADRGLERNTVKKPGMALGEPVRIRSAGARKKPIVQAVVGAGDDKTRLGRGGDHLRNRGEQIGDSFSFFEAADVQNRYRRIRGAI